KIAKEYQLKILEDGAQGFGGSINGRKACSFGDAATTSFFPAKPLGCYGDGGAIFTNDDETAKKIESLKVHGKGVDKYDNISIGINSRLDTIQAAILNIKLRAFIEHELSDSIKIAKKYDEFISDKIKKPYIPIGFISSYAQYTIILESKKQRDTLYNVLSEKGIPSMIYYNKPMNRQKAFANLESYQDKYMVSEMLSDCVLSLPMHPYMEITDIRKVANIINDFIEK
ncbi:MAG: DegT/DnrJ/EryC1/StrS family aminotransferase, partial [Bacilli bacterium]